MEINNETQRSKHHDCKLGSASLPNEIIELSSIVLLHKFNSLNG